MKRWVVILHDLFHTYDSKKPSQKTFFARKGEIRYVEMSGNNSAIYLEPSKQTLSWGSPGMNWRFASPLEELAKAAE